MLKDARSIIIALIVVLFLTMIAFEPNILDISYFSALFYFVYKFK